MKNWAEMAAWADENGVIDASVYHEKAGWFPICPPQAPDAQQAEEAVWQTYLSSVRRLSRHKHFMYQELYRYEWYEGRKRSGFWGNIEAAVRRVCHHQAPRISIFSAGSGRDLLKVGLAAGVFESTADEKIAGTHREVDVRYLRLAKPNARILLTEFDAHNLSLLQETVARLMAAGALTPEMVCVRRWDFRQAAPLVSGTQDLVVFALTGNYAAIAEQPLILREIARCVRPGGHLVAATMSDKLDFNKARSWLGKIRLFLTTPLAWPVALDFIPWQSRWGKMAVNMYDLGYWQNATAQTWMSFLEPAGMVPVAIYPGPSKFLPVEVLLAQKKEAAE